MMKDENVVGGQTLMLIDNYLGLNEVKNEMERKNKTKITILYNKNKC